MTHADIIDALGGNNEIVKETGALKSAVSNWRRRGIPWRTRPLIARMAKEKGVLLPADFLVEV